MCGFVGIFKPTAPISQIKQSVVKMMESLKHRGPDGEGIYSSLDIGLSLGHKRLSIIDPKNGSQPMLTNDMLQVIVFNGAIYNHLELRQELVSKGHPITSFSDTEVLLYAYREWGELCVNHLLGMFAFAIWDSVNQKLFCARDRVGIKPFYYHFSDNTFIFGSEIKAILSEGSIRRAVNPDGLQDYLTFQFCLGDKTMFDQIYKLEPGHTLTVFYKSGNLELLISEYWDVDYQIDQQHDESWFVDNLAILIEDSIRMHLRSDVPLGAHLSGGLDSSAIVSYATQLLSQKGFKTFTGAFSEGPQFDETGYAKIVAQECGAEYHQTYIDGAELSEVLPKLMFYMDEPAAGPGLIPQYYVSRLAGKHVKVVMGGQGGDELFVGYARYMVAYLEKTLFGAISQTGSGSNFAVTLESLVPNLPVLQSYLPMIKGFWKEGLFDSDDRRYFRLIDRSEGFSNLFEPSIFRGSYSPFESFQKVFNKDGLGSLINRMTYFDLKGSLPALLHVEDRTSMAASIESRVPLLDHRIIEFMAKIPPNIKFSGGRMKHLFKEVVKNIVPKQIFERKDKMGFPTPLTQWTKGVAREFVFDTLLSDRARQRGIYNFAEIEKVLNTENEFGRVVWGLLCLELWYRVHIDGDYQLNE